MHEKKITCPFVQETLKKAEHKPDIYGSVKGAE